MNTIIDSKEALDNGALSAVELTKASLEAANTWQPHTNAFLEMLEKDALKGAKDQDKARKAGTVGELSGIPIAIKDLICTKEGHTTAASKILERFQSLVAATVVERIKSAGGIIIGKTNLDEFAMGASNEFSAFGPVKNPWDNTRVAGGSSGGSAVVVATGAALASLGTDTGGSTRIPASFCNVVGLKPTYGRVSRFGVISYASSFDQVAPFTRTVKDAAVVFKVIAGQDRRDATSSSTEVGDYVSACGRDIKGLTIGIPEEFFGDEVDTEVKKVVRTAIGQLEDMGAKTKSVSLSLMSAAVPTYYLLVKSEASSNLARYDGLRYGKVDLTEDTLTERYSEARGKYFGPEVKRSILMGTYALSSGYYDAWYKQASKVRTLIRQEMEQLFTEVDVIAGPVSPEVAFKTGDKTDDPLAMYLTDMLTDSASVAGLPAMSVPAGFSQDMPVGLQLIAPHFAEERLFKVGHAYEQANEWYKQTPEVPEN